MQIKYFMYICWYLLSCLRFYLHYKRGEIVVGSSWIISHEVVTTTINKTGAKTWKFHSH